MENFVGIAAMVILAVAGYFVARSAAAGATSPDYMQMAKESDIDTCLYLYSWTDL